MLPSARGIDSGELTVVGRAAGAQRAEEILLRPGADADGRDVRAAGRRSAAAGEVGMVAAAAAGDAREVFAARDEFDRQRAR